MSGIQSEKIRILKPNFARRSNKKRIVNLSRIVPYLVKGWEQKLEENPEIKHSKKILDLVQINLKHPIVSLNQIEHLKYFLGDHFAAYLRKVSKAMAVENDKTFKAREKYQARLLQISQKTKIQQRSTN
ncbi:hypothetical protein LOD99_69 [Oopsacas minuta]|uniref:Uncharacterized protein n=1 Tax=Oopsacas minuta TaxID=111878 RepID=A0AAV7K7R0_9METZ|nr:hypothetical protein LOD99_69 [Oopsacas minuta]